MHSATISFSRMKTDAETTDLPRILIVDDDRFMRVQLRQAMTQEGYLVEEAENGKVGLSVYNDWYPNIVLMDAVMPVMDGFDCCASLSRLSIHKFEKQLQSPPPVLMITSLEDQRSVDRAFEAGAADYVTKPIHWAVLRQRVRRLLYQQQLYQTLQETNKKLAEANQALERLASLDSLTQVANRRRFDYSLQKEWRRLAREKLPLALILADIDYFKLYNDTYGHQAGDYCLFQVAQTIQSVVKRPADLVARYGGEEFAIILPNTTAQGAVAVAQAIRAQIERLNLPHVKSPNSGKVSLSMGVSCIQPDHQLLTPAGLIAAADHSLYQAKAAGRDAICFQLKIFR